MTERDWVELLASKLRVEAGFRSEIRIETQLRLPYGYEVHEFGEAEKIKVASYATDLILVEDLPNGNWLPRVVIEAKVGSVTTHDAITYSQKASTHKGVCPFVRYGIALGKRGKYPLPGRLYRHGANFDFMSSFVDYEPTQNEFSGFAELLVDEIEASRQLERLLYESRLRGRERFTKLHRKLCVGDLGP